MKRSTFLLTATTLIAALLSGCGEEAGPQNRGVYLLMDTSGTYTVIRLPSRASIRAASARRTSSPK